MRKIAWVTGALLVAGVGQGWAVPYGEFLKAPTLPALYGKQTEIKTPQKVFRINEFDVQNRAYPWAQVSIGGEKVDFSILIQSPYLDDQKGDKAPGAFLEIDLAFRNNKQEPINFNIDTSTWKLVTVGADKRLYVNPMVKLANASESGFRDVAILWEASPKDYTPPKFSLTVWPGSAIILANYDISHALKVARDTTQGRTLPQMFLVVGDALAYEIPPYILPQSGPDKAAVDRIVENVEKAMGEGRK